MPEERAADTKDYSFAVHLVENSSRRCSFSWLIQLNGGKALRTKSAGRHSLELFFDLRSLISEFEDLETSQS